MGTNPGRVVGVVTTLAAGAGELVALAVAVSLSSFRASASPMKPVTGIPDAVCHAMMASLVPEPNTPSIVARRRPDHVR